MGLASFEGGGFFSNTSNPRTETTSNTATTNNASYGSGNPLNINLSNINASGKYSQGLTLSPTINMLDGGAIQAALGVVERSQETQSNQALQFAEIARQAGQPAGALIENIGKYIMISVVVGVVSLVVWKKSK